MTVEYRQCIDLLGFVHTQVGIDRGVRIKCACLRHEIGGQSGVDGREAARYDGPQATRQLVGQALRNRSSGTGRADVAGVTIDAQDPVRGIDRIKYPDGCHRPRNTCQGELTSFRSAADYGRGTCGRCHVDIKAAGRVTQFNNPQPSFPHQVHNGACLELRGGGVDGSCKLQRDGTGKVLSCGWRIADDKLSYGGTRGRR